MSNCPFYDIFAPTKFPLLKFLMTSLHMICDLAPPSIKNPGYAYEAQLRLHKKLSGFLQSKILLQFLELH